MYKLQATSHKYDYGKLCITFIRFSHSFPPGSAVSETRNVFLNGKLVLGFQLFSLVKNKDENYEVNNHHQSLISLFYIV